MATVDRLRADIDSGKTGDKVAGSDPAAAPLGTDEEAAGTPIPRAAVAIAHSREVDRRGKRAGMGSAVIIFISIIGVLTVILVAIAAGLIYASGGH